MKCMKCGRKHSTEQAFCEDCLADMERYPVNPSTPVNLPPKTNDEPAKRTVSRRTIWKAEHTIASQRNWLIFMIILCACLAVALTIALSMLLGGDPLAPFDFLNI